MEPEKFQTYCNMGALGRSCLRFILLIVLLGTSSLMVSAQSWRLKAYQFAVNTRDSRGEWDGWSEWMSCDIIISVNLNENKIRIFSEEEMQDYSMVQPLGEKEDANGIAYVSKCIDINGLVCHVSLRRQFYPKEALQLYIEYSDATWAYSVVKY